MSIFKKEINFSDLISFGVNGLSVGNAQQVRESLMKMYRNIYGQDIDLDDASADGQYTTEIAFILTKMLQALAYLNSNLKPSSASGQFLDTICSFNNIKRKSDTNSTAKIIVRNTEDDDPFSGIGSGNVHSLIFRDVNGHNWTWQEVPYQTGNGYHYNYVFEKDVDTIIEVTCEDTGPVNALKNDNIINNGEFILNVDASGDPLNAGDINTCISAPSLICWQITDAVIGNYAETDEELRTRRLRESYGNGVSILEGLKSDIYSTGYVKEVLIVNNNTDKPSYQNDQTEVSPHNIYIVIRYIPVKDSDIDQLVDESEIGYIIYNDLTPGVSTTEYVGRDSDVYGKTIPIKVYSNINENIYWKQAKPIVPEFTIDFICNKDFVVDNLKDVIYDNINSYINDMALNEDLHIADILTAINSSNNVVNGKVCFIATQGTFSDNSNYMMNTLNYFTLSDDYTEEKGYGYKFDVTILNPSTTQSLSGTGRITLTYIAPSENEGE